jgi:hypothetical protein
MRRFTALFAIQFPVLGARSVLITASLLPLLSGCPKKPEANPVTVDAGPIRPPPPKVTESCDQAAALGMCMDYTRTDVVMHRTLCEGFKGKFAELPCSKDRVVGSCALEDGDIKRYYEKLGAKDVGYTVDKAKENCEGALLKGKFAPKE